MKWNIQKRLLVLVLAAGILSFLAMSGLSFYSLSIMRNEMLEIGDELGNAGATLTEKLMSYQIKKTLGELATSRASFIDSETSLIKSNVRILSDTMTKIASNPEKYKPLTVVDPRTSPVKMGESYIIYAPDLKGNVTPEIQAEIAIAANIKTLLMPMAKSYVDCKSSFFVGSKNGWFICSSIFPGQEFSPVTDEEINKYDPRKRPWYENGILAGKPVFSDLYMNIDTDEYQLIGCSAPYYDRNGVAGVVGMDVSNTDIYKAIDETAVGDNGFSFVLNKDGEVIFCTQTKGELLAKAGGKDLRQSESIALSYAAEKMTSGESGILPVTVDGEEYFLAFAPMKKIGWSFGTLTLRKNIMDDAEESRNYFLKQIEGFTLRLQEKLFFVTFIGALLLSGLFYIFFAASNKLSAVFVKPIYKLSDGVREIASGNLDKKLDVQTGDEIEHLATSFNAMTDELKTYMTNLTKVTAEKERFATELDVAKEIQNGMLPKDFPTREDFELFATMTPAKEVGGDFYDFYMIDETHLAVTVADVSGKGIPAALFMVIAKTVLNNFAVSKHNIDGLAEVVAAANDKLCANNEAMMFVTAFIGVLDLQTGEFVYVNAGHNPPVIYRAEKNSCEFLDVKKNFVLGPMDGIPFAEQKVSLKRGDLLFLYTDGVTEALNVAEEEYLPERLIKFMNSTDCAADLKVLLANVRADLSAHVGDAEQSDDITMFALRFKR